jgi:hypothetical protein
VAVVVIALLAAAAVVGTYIVASSGDPSPAAVGSADDPMATVPAPEPATTLATVAPAPDPVDFLAVVRGIVQVSNDLRVHPDPSRLTEYMETSDAAYGDSLTGQSQLVTGVLRYDPAPSAPTVGSVKVVARDPDLAVVNVTFDSIPRYRVLDRQGQVVSDSPASAGSTAQWKLHRTNGTWRLVGAQALGGGQAI